MDEKVSEVNSCRHEEEKEDHNIETAKNNYNKKTKIYKVTRSISSSSQSI
jgi:hypothetical protein